jgi:Tfp pilus assembly protein PilF
MLNTDLCDCGSGLRAVRCCALDMAVLPAAESLALLDASGLEATRLYNEQKLAEATALALKLLDLAPNHRMPLRVLFEIRRGETKARAAEALARRLADLPSDNAQVTSAANLQLAQLVIGRGRYAEAEGPARKAVVAAPRDPTVHHVMGVVLTETGRPQAGEAHYRKALALLGRDDGMVLANTAWNLKLQGRLEEAAALYKRALALRPDNSRAVGGFAQVEMGRGRRAEAAALLDEALTRWPADRTLRLLRVLVDLAAGDGGAVLARLDDAPESLLPAELAARGQAFALLDRPAEAVSHYALGKKIQRERYGHAYEPGPLAEKAARYKAFFTADRLLGMPRAAAADGPMPVFLLGFPRSGTALLEQMLAQVPGVSAGDELFPLEALAADSALKAGAPDYPDNLTDLLVGDGLRVPDAMRADYLRLRQQAGLEGQFITDRNAGNIWHLGLIKLLFPEAPVIHLLRHPLDVMLSNLSQERRLEGNCGVSMAALARHYDLSMSLVRHFRGQLALRYLPVRYEDLVTAPEATLNQVLGFIGAGAAPAEAVLRENNAAANPVPAHFAGREPLHRRGLGRWRRYEMVLPELFRDARPVLDPWIAALGYGAPA